MGTTKVQRKEKERKRKIEWLKRAYGVEGFNLYDNRRIAKKQLPFAPLKEPGAVLRLLEASKEGKVRIKYVDDDMLFDTLDEFREYLFVKSLSGLGL